MTLDLKSLILELTPKKMAQTHDFIFPYDDPDGLVEFADPMREALEDLARIMINRIRDTTLDGIPGDDPVGYVYEILRIQLVCGLKIGLESNG